MPLPILNNLSIYVLTKLKVENSFINYFDKKTEIYQGMKLIDEKLGGTTPLEIIIDEYANTIQLNSIATNQRTSLGKSNTPANFIL